MQGTMQARPAWRWWWREEAAGRGEVPLGGRVTPPPSTWDSQSGLIRLVYAYCNIAYDSENPQEARGKKPPSSQQCRRSTFREKTQPLVYQKDINQFWQHWNQEQWMRSEASSHLVSTKAGSCSPFLVRSLQRLSTINWHGYYLYTLYSQNLAIKITSDYPKLFKIPEIPN